MKAWKRGVACVTAAAMLVCGMSFVESHAASAIKLSNNKVTLAVGKTIKIRVKNYKKKVTWSSAKKAVATVTSAGKYVGKIKAKRAGSTKIYARCGNSKLVCKVTVKKQSTPTRNEQNVSVTTATVRPTTKPTTKPGTSVNANQKYLADQTIAYDEEEGVYHLYFSIKLSDNQTRKKYAGKVELQVYNIQQELVYNQSKSFTVDDFLEEDEDAEEEEEEEENKEEEDLADAECLCDVEIPASEFLPGESSEGILYYSIILEDDTWFSKRTLNIDHLPVKVTDRPEETLAPIITKTPEVKPTDTVAVLLETPVPTIKIVTEETIYPTMVLETQKPTSTPTETPTATPRNSKAPTKTPSPTETVMPTDSPLPTKTVTPTETVEPTGTPTMTPYVTITPTPEAPPSRDEELESSMQILRTYIIINGKIDSHGNFYLEWESENGVWKNRITCNLTTDAISYSVESTINGYDAVLVMESNPFTSSRSILTCRCSSQDLSQNGVAVLSFENLTYSRFIAKNFYIMGDISDDEMQNVANILWYYGMDIWNSKLDDMGLSLKQVGYDNYGNTEIETVDTKYPMNPEKTTTSSTMEKWKQYIQSVGEAAENEVQRIYIKDGNALYFVSYDSSSNLFTYGMEKNDRSVSLNITTNPIVQPLAKIIYKEENTGTIYADVDVGTLTGTENVSFEAKEEGDWVEQMQKNANVCLERCYTNWNCLAQCAGITLNNVGFSSYGRITQTN